MALLNDDFDNLSLLYENDSTVIFKGVRKEDQKKVILKSHKNPDEMFRIKHEFDLLSGKNIAGASNVLAISYNDDKNYLVLEDEGGIVLDDYLENNEMDVDAFLTISQNAAKSLASIHDEDIIHCDIKPANMLVHPDTLTVWYIDFGISFSLHQKGVHSEGFAGTLEYMAPEQTGRLNMVVDARSDLYSLGITMYSMITGNMPFQGETAVELIHAHTVLNPQPISNFVVVDDMINAIITKLMEKAPRKRYQSASSLAYDLETCRNSLSESGSIEEFTLGEKDVFSSLEPGQRLFGKEVALEEMASVFHSVPTDESRLILLHGPEGCGKSSLLQGFESYVEKNNGYLLKGSFDGADNDEPYSAIREAFTDFELFVYNSNLPLPEYRNRVLEALGENAQVLLDIIPSVEQSLGKQKPVRKLNPLETQERARQVFGKMTEIICDAPHPYVFVYENVQWSDENSLDLLLSAIENEKVGNCIMVLSYRDDDHAFVSSLMPRVQKLRRNTMSVIDIPITNLNKEQVGELLIKLFDQEDLQTSEMVDILYDATGGVLSKIHNYLQLMYRTKQIQYDSNSDTWSFHIENLDDSVLASIENKYTLIYEKMMPYKQEALCKFACIGENFSLAEAATLYDYEGQDLKVLLERITESGFLVKNRKDSDRYAFVHKNVYENCYQALSKEAQQQNHQKLVERLYAIYHDSKEDMLKLNSLLIRQMLLAGPASFSKEMIIDICQYGLQIAESSMASANISYAIRTYQNGLSLLGENPFAFDYKLAYKFYLNKAMCFFALHEYKDAKRVFEIVLNNVNNEDDRYEAYFEIVDQYLKTADWENAEKYCNRYLADTGLLIPDDKTPIDAGDDEYMEFVRLTGKDGITVYLSYEQTADKMVEYRGNMLILLADALLFNLDDRFKYYLYKAINFGIRHKSTCSEFTRIFCIGAARYASIRDYKKSKWLIEVGLEYAEKNQTSQAFLWCIYGNMISHWINPMSETLEIYKNAKHHAIVEGNAFYEAFADMMLLNYHSFIGENLDEYHRETETTLHNLERNRSTALHANFVTFRQYARCLTGRTFSPDSFDDGQFKEASLEEIRGTWNGTFNDNFFYIYRMRALYAHGYYEKAEEYALKYEAISYEPSLSVYITHAQFHYFYILILLKLCEIHPEKTMDYLDTIKIQQEQLAYFARLNPINFEYKFKFIQTGVKSLTSDTIDLLDEYAKEYEAFLEKGFLWDAIFVDRQVADYWQKRNNQQYVLIHKKNALAYFKKIGAKHLIRELADVDDEKEKKRTSHHHASHMSKTHFGGTQFDTRFSTTVSQSQYSGLNVALDFHALLEVFEELVKMDTLPTLANQFMSMLLKNGNGEKALLVLEDGTVMNLTAAKYAIDSSSEFNDVELPLDIQMLDDDLIPKKLIELVKTKNKLIYANSARNEYRATGDEYLRRHVPESFLMMPISAKDQFLGVVYLENASLPGSFPEGRIRFLQAMALQASVLILNLKNVAVMELYTKDLEQRLSSYLAQQNSLIAGIAHEINSPVGVCLTVATKLHESTATTIKNFEGKTLSKSALYKYFVESRDGLNIINNNILRAGDLIRNFKQMSVEQSTEVFEDLELKTALESIISYIRPGVKKKIDKVEVSISEDLRIYSSNGVLAQIFTNLIMNSAIHGFEDMDKEDCHAEIQVTDFDSRGEIEIRYSDNGKGMTEEELEKVFQPFYTTKRNRGGSGLGGHIIQSLITQTLEGSVRCISAPGEGTTYIIRLPKDKRKNRKEELSNE